tara:strand:- start:879 stop:1352 length:474 start_codon:yes stop_codon:yes gene_type:complete
MPAVNQDFTIHDLDYFQVRFNVTDATNAIDDSTARAWWGVAENSSDGAQGTYLLIERSNLSWNAALGFEQVNFGNTAYLSIEPTYIDVLVVLKDIIDTSTAQKGGSAALTPSSGNYPATYYHECIYAGNGAPRSSTAIATGQITVERSLFTELAYRA